jgi:hypothetical protein
LLSRPSPTHPPPTPHLTKVGKKWFNMRLCPEDVSDELSGFGHNGVSPVGLAAPLPIILSHRITQLQPDFFFCGRGKGAAGGPGGRGQDA